MNVDIVLWLTAGFISQFVDGSIGMGYGVIGTTILMSGGVSPAFASALIHLAEIFTTAASGLSHVRVGNVQRNILLPLVVSGMIGGSIGAALCVVLSAESPIFFTILVSILLQDMGVLILYRFVKRPARLIDTPNADSVSEPRIKLHFLSLLGLIASFTDAVGGGGWGPIATASIILEGFEPHKVVGSINVVEFFVTIVQSVTFMMLLQEFQWDIILALLLGGVIAAPFAARCCKKLPTRALGSLIGITLITLSIRNILTLVG